jgi:replicative DNA helicase
MGQFSNDTLSTYVFGKVQPQAIQMEEAVLGAVMLDREAFGIVCELLRPEHFYTDAHQHIYRAICDLSGRSCPIDLLTVTEELKKNGTLDSIGGGYYLVELSNRVASAANIEAHARIIAEMHIRREVIRVSTESLQAAYEHGMDTFETLDGAMAGLMGIMSPYQTAKNMVSIGDAAHEVLQEIDRAMSGIGGEAVKTGLAKLDQLSGGFFPGEMTIIAARPGMGKTELALTCAEWASLNGKKAHFTTLEMTAKQLARRVMSKRSGISTGKIRRAELDSVEIRALQEVADFLKRAKLTISAHRGKNSLWQFVRRAVAKNEMDILFVDYAQLMEDDEAKKNGNREQEISAISRTLKRISTEFNIPVVLLAQLSRQVESRADRMPQLSDLRESGSLEQDADNVYFMVRLDQYGIFEYQETYDNILPAGNYQTSGKILLYSKKFRSDSQFGMMLDFVGGHIFDNSGQTPPSSFTPSFDPSAARPGPGEEVPF